MIIFFYVNKLLWSKKLPLDSIYNPFGFIEAHIGNKCNGDQKIFYKFCIDLTIIGINENKDILIDTWLVSQRTFEKVFSDALEIKKLNLLQVMYIHINKVMYNIKYKIKHKSKNLNNKNYNNKPCRYIIHVDKLTDAQKEIIKDKSSRFEKRFA